MESEIALKILQVSGILIFALIVWGGLHTAFQSLEKRLDRQQNPNLNRVLTILRLVRHLLSITLFLLTVALVLDQLGVGVGPILAGAGIVGITVGLGIQPVLKNCIAGGRLIMEDRLRVGEIACINGKQGTVEEVTLHSIVLRDWNGTLHIFPNGEVSTMSNLSRAWSATVVSIPVSLKENMKYIRELLQQIGDEMAVEEKWSRRRVKCKVLGPTDIDERFVTIQIRLVTAPTRHWGAAREYQTRVLRAFKIRNIAHSTLHDGPLSKTAVAWEPLQSPPEIPDLGDGDD